MYEAGDGLQYTATRPRLFVYVQLGKHGWIDMMYHCIMRCGALIPDPPHAGHSLVLSLV